MCQDAKGKVEGKVEAEAPEAEDFLASLAAAAAAYVKPWLPEAFPVKGSEGSAPPELHEAVWAQAKLCEARVERTVAKGRELRARIESQVTYVWAELGRWIEDRLDAEMGAAEEAVAVGQAAVEARRPIPEDYVLDGTSLLPTPGVLLVPLPAPHPEPSLPAPELRRLSQTQALALARALHEAAAAEGFSEDHVSTGALIDLLLRLASGDGALPPYWTEALSPGSVSQLVDNLDPADSGLVPVAAVVDFFVAGVPLFE